MTVSLFNSIRKKIKPDVYVYDAQRHRTLDLTYVCSSDMLNEILKSLRRAEKTEVLSEDLLQVSRLSAGQVALMHERRGGCHEAFC